MNTMHVVVASTALASLAAPAHADKTTGSATVYPAKGMLIVELSTGEGPLPDLAPMKKAGTVRCTTAADAPVPIGCYVGIKRDGTFTSPVFNKGDAPLAKLLPPTEGSYAWTYDKNKQLEVSINGATANAIGLWVDCAPQRGTLRCDTENGMAGKFNWTIRFVVIGGGQVRSALAK